MTFDKILACSGGGLFLLLTLIQLAPIQVNPWSAIARWVGRAVNGEVLGKLGKLEKQLDEHIDTDDKRDADSHRLEILRFNNELLRSVGHTKEEFIEVLAEIDAYEKFCTDHPDYPNNRAVLAIENIQENYKERLKKHDFLREGEIASAKDPATKEDSIMEGKQVEKIVQEVMNRINPTYNTIDEVPSYWREDIRELVDKGVISGSGNGKLGLTHSDCKAAVLAKRIKEKL